MAVPREGKVKRKKETELIQIIPRIFKNKNEAEFAIDLIGRTLSCLEIGKHTATYFPIECSANQPFYINISLPKRKTVILEFNKSLYYDSGMLEILLQADGVNGFGNKYLHLNIDKHKKEPDVRLYKLPIEMAISLKDDIISSYEWVLNNFVSMNKKPIAFKTSEEEVEERALRDIFLQAHKNTKECNELFSNLSDIQTIKQPIYTLDECSEETGFNIDLLKKWVQAVNHKGQIIFYGPPGTGKTFMAERLGSHLVSDSYGFVEVIQFHPAYAYEDFMQGIRPQSRDDGTLNYPLLPGRFIEFCRKAELRDETHNPCVLIIDEINRADLSKVFGELLYLLEFSIRGRRDRKIPLSSGDEFCIPNNVRIIGTMNTADRSIALVDHALRRRFAFIHLGANYEILRNYHKKNNTGFPVDRLIDELKQINRKISDPHYELGMSFFMCENLSAQIEGIWTLEIEPFLEEYYFDRMEHVDEFRWENIRSKILE